jgi:DNA polymerase-3 subunit delta
VVLLWGEDDFLLREAALEAIGPDLRAREVDAAEWQAGETADLATPSLFGDRRALIVSDARRLGESAQQELAAYLADPAPDAPLVLCATVPTRGKAPAALVKLVKPVGEIREVKITRRDLPGWVMGRAKARGVQLAPDAAAALVETVGEEPGALDQAIVQLSTAFGGSRITREAVASQFRGLGDQHIWDLCDRAFGRDLPGAIRSVRTLLESREEGLMILGGVASRLRDLLRVKALPEQLPPSELARAAGLRFEWQARRYREQARRFTLDQLLAIHDRLVEADRSLKSGASDDVVLPMLVSVIADAATA